MLWNISTNELSGKSPEFLADQIVKKAQPGGVILLHDGYGTLHNAGRANKSDTVEMLPIIIQQLQSKDIHLLRFPNYLTYQPMTRYMNEFIRLLSQALEITSTFNPQIAIILFLFCLIGEIGFTLPYILETIWLLAGYHLVVGTLSSSDLLLIWLVAQAGRQTGSLVLYYSAALGLGPLRKFYRRFIEPRVPKKQFIPAGIAKIIANPSPFSVAIGRLIGLRVPMAITMSARQKLSHLALGVLLSSIVWDGIYLIVGAR